MSSEDIMPSYASSNSNDLGRKSLCVNFDAKHIVTASGTAVEDVEDDLFTMEDLGQPKEGNKCAQSKVEDLEKDSIGRPPGQETVQSVSNIKFSELDTVQCLKNGDDCTNTNGSVDQIKEVGIHEKLVGVKGPQEECNSMESSVRVVYSSLPSRSKRKLEEFLSHWSDWHSKHCASAKDPADSLESGEETYFPALHVGSDKTSTVSFSMDIHVSKRQRKGSVSLDECSSLYDRGFAVGLTSDAGATEESGLDLREAPRCFNCGSYNHPLSGCTKPFNKTAINNARKDFQSKKIQNGSPRVLTRYYQDTPAGKFDGLKPGALSAETRKLLGLGELDPPPWLDRMRELGYPPGYIDKEEEEDQPSGIAIFGDDPTLNVVVRNDPPLVLQKCLKKMMTSFPGINGPIPENADKSRWETPRGPFVSAFPQYRPENRLNFAEDSLAFRNYHDAHGPRNHIEGPLSPFGFGSPPLSHHPYDYHPREPYSPVGLPIPGNPHYAIVAIAAAALLLVAAAVVVASAAVPVAELLQRFLLLLLSVFTIDVDVVSSVAAAPVSTSDAPVVIACCTNCQCCYCCYRCTTNKYKLHNPIHVC